MESAFLRPALGTGWIEVIVGCMFSGKTEELIKQVRRARIGKQKVQTFKAQIDTRYAMQEVASHDHNRSSAFAVGTAAELAALVEPTTRMVAIDEAQFFDDGLIQVATALASQGRRVLLAGLDTDWRGRPFGPMAQLLAIAEVVHKQHAICAICGGAASRTQRLSSSTADIIVGSSEFYEARCRMHFDPESVLRSLTDVRPPLSVPKL